MCPLVILQQSFRSKRLVAFTAGKGTLSRMSSLVYLQIGCIGILDVTALTAKGHLNTSMEFGVLFQDRISDEPLATDIA